MLILPSVGATVRKIVLNDSATKAKIYFNEGTSIIINTTNVPGVKKASMEARIPSGKMVAKKKLVKKPGMTSVSTSSMIKTHQGPMSFSMIKNPEAMAKQAQNVIERAKKRAEILEAKTMDGSAKMAAMAQDGQEYTMPS